MNSLVFLSTFSNFKNIELTEQLKYISSLQKVKCKKCDNELKKHIECESCNKIDCLIFSSEDFCDGCNKYHIFCIDCVIKSNIYSFTIPQPLNYLNVKLNDLNHKLNIPLMLKNIKEEEIKFITSVISFDYFKEIILKYSENLFLKELIKLKNK